MLCLANVYSLVQPMNLDNSVVVRLAKRDIFFATDKKTNCTQKNTRSHDIHVKSKILLKLNFLKFEIF